MKPYETMDLETLEREYSPSSCIDDIMVYIDQYEKRSAEAQRKLQYQIRPNIKYGIEERSHMDIFVPDGTGPFPIHVFIHGGYWQQLSKNESCFAAPNFIDHNIIFIALDYTLAPQASIGEIIDQTRRGVIAILKNAPSFNGDPENITISGSSAGGHLVAEVLSTDWNAYGYDRCPLKGALAISGVFDLEPLVKTYVNEPLKMTVDDARAASPLHHVPDDCCPIIFTYGENETSEFKRQTHEYMDECLRRGIDCAYLDMPAVNHFDIVFDLNEKDSPLFQAILHQIEA
ncbi:MAG TPA: alpha/beta hydrolase [Emcibacteraceae bacterium]|nr:alpha/beta hydrolase [Emcibacteraceae bacterium]HRW28918.1 alpha/beta hydrolase [Emcibacteraceae bacterium]